MTEQKSIYNKHDLKEALDLVQTAACNGRMCSVDCKLWKMFFDCPVWVLKRQMQEDGLI